MRFFNEIKNDSIFVKICTVILIIQCALIAFCNIGLAERNIDCDVAKLYVHAVEMVRNHTYIIPDWSMITTLEIDCSLLFAVPIYAFCKDIYVSFGIANVIMVLILVGTLFYLFEGRNTLHPLLCANFILIPYRTGQLDYFNMMFFNGSQYIMKVLIPLILVALLIRTEKDEHRIGRADVGFGILYSVFLLVSCISSGVYVPIIGVFAVMVGFGLFHLLNKKSISRTSIVWMILSVILSAVGLLGNSRLALDAKGNSMALCSVYGELQDNIIACFWGMFELFGGVAYENIPVMSFAGIKILLHMVFVIILVFVGIVTGIKIIRKTANLDTTMLFALFLWNYFVLSVCQTKYGVGTFEYRYHLMGMIPLICMGVINLIEWYQKENIVWQKGIMRAILLMLLLLHVTSYKEVYEHRTYMALRKNIFEWCTAEEYDKVYFYNNSTEAEMLRLLDYKNENVTYLTVNDDGKTVVYDYYDKYNNVPIETDNCVILVADTSNEKFYLAGEEYELIHMIDFWGVYKKPD